MKIQISEKLNHAFNSTHKNQNYALSFLLSSMDLDTCAECIKLVEEFKLFGERVYVEIDKSNIDTIRNVFGNAEDSLIEQLLWISILFPEI